MAVFRMTFAAEAKKVEFKKVGTDEVVEVSICRKQKGRNGAEDTFCWLRISIWKPPEWLSQRLAVGVFIAGSGEFTSRSYESNTGEKKTSMEVRCTGFDIEVGGASDRTAQAPAAASAPATAPRRPAPAANLDEEVPF